MLLSAFFAGLLATSAAAQPGDAALWRVYEKRDFFSLERGLSAPSSSDSASVRFLRAQTFAAFGKYDDSSRLLRALLQDHVLEPSLETPARERLMLNERAMFRYREALAAIQPLLQGSDAQIHNRAALLLQLQDVGPESLRRSTERAALSLDRFGAIAATVNGVALRVGIDTAANLSVLSHSAARKAGLRIRRAGYRIRLATSRTISTDVAVGELRLSNGIEISNLVFLVLADSVLRVSAHREIDGLIGFPELAKIGPIQFRRDRTLVLNGQNLRGPVQAIALVENDPVITASVRGAQMFCRIDTGSNRTVLYGFPSERMPIVVVAKRSVPLVNPVFLPRSSANQRHEQCSLGRDALHRLAPYTLDLHAMQIGFEH